MMRTTNTIQEKMIYDQIQSCRIGLSWQKALIGLHTKSKIRMGQLINTSTFNRKNFHASDQQSILIFLLQLLTMRETWWEI